MAAREMNDVDDFLGDNKRRGSGVITDWKSDGELVIWLHKTGRPISLWRHPLPVRSVREEEGQPIAKVFMGTQHVCHEEGPVLKEQFFRNDDGSRQNPPKRCPVDRLVEWVYLQVQAGALDIAAPFFRVEATDPKSTLVLHAGGLYNYGGRKRQESTEQLYPGEKRGEKVSLKTYLKTRGIYLKDSFKEIVQAKHEYLLRVVVEGKAHDGVQRLFVTGDVGDKVKDVIVAARADLGKDKGDPFQNPFAIKLEYFEKEQDPKRKYKVTKLGQVPLTDDVADLLDGEAPDVAQSMAPLNRATLRANLERWCLVKGVPWDDLFKPYEDAEDPGDAQQEERSSRGRSQARPPTPAKDDGRAVEGRRRKKAVEAPALPPEETIPCDDCKKPMGAKDTKCAHCGAEYDVEEDAATPPPPPPPRTRGQAKRGVQQPAPVNDDVPGDVPEDDRIPF